MGVADSARLSVARDRHNRKPDFLANILVSGLLDPQTPRLPHIPRLAHLPRLRPFDPRPLNVDRGAVPLGYTLADSDESPPFGLRR